MVTNTDLVLQNARTPFVADMDASNSVIVANNQVYRDIVIDGDVARLCELRNFNTPWGSQTNSALGNIKGVRFENRLAVRAFVADNQLHVLRTQANSSGVYQVRVAKGN